MKELDKQLKIQRLERVIKNQYDEIQELEKRNDSLIDLLSINGGKINMLEKVVEEHQEQIRNQAKLIKESMFIMNPEVKYEE